MEQKTKRQRSYSVYLPSEGRTESVGRETYFAYYRPVWRLCKRMERAGRCAVGCDWWNCLGDCGLCRYAIAESGGAPESAADMPDSGADIEQLICKKELLEALYEELKALGKSERLMCSMIMRGLNGSKAAETLGISRTTYLYRKKKLLARLRKALEDFA